VHGPINVNDGVVDAAHPVIAALAGVMSELNRIDGGDLTETARSKTFVFLNANPTDPRARRRYVSIALEFKYEPPFEWRVGVSSGEGLVFGAWQPYADAATVQVALDSAQS
jgi:hypothetical protein